MVLELGKAVSFLLSILSLYSLALSAFFIPGSRWQDRLSMALLHVALAGCVCFASGFVFSWPTQASGGTPLALTSTLPVRIFLWSLLGLALLFVTSWYLDVYYLTLLWRNQP